MATISCHHARAALGGLRDTSAHPHATLQAAGINPKLVQLPMARINDHQMASLVQTLWAQSQDEFMGFTEHPCEPGAFAYMVNSIRRCESLREALTMGMRFYQLLTKDIDTRLIEHDEQAEIQVRFAQPELDAEHFYQEFWMIIWHRLASWLCGVKIPLLQTHLTHSADISDEHRSELSIMFPGQLYLEQSVNRLVFSRQHLNHPLIRNQREINTFLKHSPSSLLTIPGDDQTFQHRITRYLNAQLKIPLEFPDVGSLAQHFHISVQTLHRRLKQEGSNYQQIKDNIRRDLALNKLVRERLPVHQVAEIVGFSEARSFTRAFKNWTGLSPREYCKFLK
ncbi:MAG: AraC family transcriptional regulator [Cellvibrionaceae bacterium]|nr:AraC family transcriptional regulator [Cellvibrionaceae bacterium]|tara:strand:- start:2288 stop:3301 length:1014 start_codon:yes stop_codon:yes gene_type:complete